MKVDQSADVIVATLLQTQGTVSDFGKTILPATPSPASTASRSQTSRLELLSLIGEGGMAQVHLAEQQALGRHVAVKMLRTDQQSESMAHRLVQEAWTTGALEHPNIVPVHDILTTEDGQPQVVLKRIEGRTWSDVLSDPARAPLQEQLRVLMDVARAVDFAHRRGFVHRDIKPENVLVGVEGDVYLVDWGIALATDPKMGDRFPLAADARLIAGTPAYMAPEMLDPARTPPGPWTDVYLLGSVLYEILTQRPPHEGESMGEIIHAILHGPTMPDHEPELVRICARAMERDPHARFESALQFRLALEGYLQHEGARSIAAKADAAFEKVRECRAKGEAEAADAALARSRFGYQAALEAWPDFHYALEQLRQLDLQTIRAELDAGNMESAARLILRVADPPPSLVAEVRAAEEARLDELRHRESLAAQANEATGRGARAAMSGLLGAIWVLGPLFRSAFVEATPLGLLAPYIASVALALGVVVWARRALTHSYMNRALVTIILGMMLSDLSVAIMAVRYDLGYLWLVQSLPIVWACGSMIGVGLLSSRFWPTALAMTGLCFASREAPAWVNELTAGANLVLFLNAAWVNRVWSELHKRFVDQSGTPSPGVRTDD